MDICKKVGRNIQRLRREKSWSQEQLSFETNLHRTYISGVERGVRNPTITVIEKIAIALGVPASAILE